MPVQLLEITELFKTFLKKQQKDTILPIDVHIEAGMEWLSHAQDMTPDGGVPIRFSLIRGWESSYPETTGYIIPTFLKYYEITKNISFKERALKMAEWELSIQQGDGSFIGGALDKRVGKLVFDTGQIIFGFLSAYELSKDERFLNAARKAGDWLVNIQDADGAWRQYSYNSIPHAYHSRVAWSLVKLYKLTQENRYLITAKKNIDWVLSNQTPNGWFKNAGFNLRNNKAPYTHTIAYTIRGLIESGILLNEGQYIETAKRSIDELLKVMDPQGFFLGTYDSDWKGDKSFSCLTGNAQLSIICSKLYMVTGDLRYLDAVRLLNRYLKIKQDIKTNNKNIRGAIPGSYPIWGRYERFSYPNWATKFFVDALILEKENNSHGFV